MRSEKALPGNRTNEFKETEPPCGGKLVPEYDEGNTWLHLDRRIDGDVDGDANKMRDWLAASAEWLLNLS
jgi:hypothetical protein